MTSPVSRKPPHEPPRLIAAKDVVPAMQRIIEQKRAARNLVLQRTATPGKPCFANAIQPLLDVENSTSGTFTVIVLLRYASPSPESWHAAEEAIRLAAEDRAVFMKEERFFRLFAEVNIDPEMKDLDEEKRKYAEDLLREFKRCGHGHLDQSQIETYLETQNAIKRLCTLYRQNLTNSKEGVWLTLDDLDGVPKQAIKCFHQEIDQTRSDQYFVPLEYDDVQVILRYAENPATRKCIYVADVRKVEANEEIFKEVVRLRDHNARLLGYQSHASFKLEERMAKTTKWVHELLSQLQNELVPAGRKRIQQLLDRKQKHLATSRYTSSERSVMTPWDYRYYLRLEENDWNLDPEAISEFFPLVVVVPRLLDLLKACLQLKFEQLTIEEQALSLWHKDVSGWRVWDERGGDFVGYLYLDLLSRSNKFSGSQNANIQSSFVQKDGNRVYPATVVMCSFAPATPGRCTLLKHSQLMSLFHECGHAIHDLLSRTQNTTFHGHRSPPDFSEAPSTLLERWCCMPKGLVELSCHYTTLNSQYYEQWQKDHAGQCPPTGRLPEETAVALLEKREQNLVLWYLGQLATSRLDMTVHDLQSPEQIESLDFSTVWYQVREELGLPTVNDSKASGFPYADFQHLFKGYDAGCYAYLSAHVIAANIFDTVFAADPKDQMSWDRLRNELLCFGSSQDELELLTRFLGHPLDANALLKSIGK